MPITSSTSLVLDSSRLQRLIPSLPLRKCSATSTHLLFDNYDIKLRSPFDSRNSRHVPCALIRRISTIMSKFLSISSLTNSSVLMWPRYCFDWQQQRIYLFRTIWRSRKERTGMSGLCEKWDVDPLFWKVFFQSISCLYVLEAMIPTARFSAN
jgi:hypothetical protein